jgi:hypothetical protein
MAEARELTLSLLDETFALARIDPDDDFPEWAIEGSFASVARTDEEISIICPQSAIPAGVLHEGGWRCLGVVGDLDFSLAGVIASLAEPLAAAGVAILLVSTYDSDYLLVKEDRLEGARQALAAAGHTLLDER